MGDMRAGDETVAEVLRFVRELNDAWTVERRPDKLAEYFHRDIVAVAAGMPERIEGREACVAGWTAYAASHEIVGWTEEDVDVRLFGGGVAAVVNYVYRVRYRVGGGEYEESGLDTMTLVSEEGRWWLVADHFSSIQ